MSRQRLIRIWAANPQGTATTPDHTSEQHLESSEQCLGSAETREESNTTSANPTCSEAEKSGPAFDAQQRLATQGRLEARRCGATGEDVEDFLLEYLLGCWRSPNPDNVAYTCVCGANRARTFLRQERLWKRRHVLTEPTQIQSLFEIGTTAPVSTGTATDNRQRLISPIVLTAEPTLTPETILLLHELRDRLLSLFTELTALQQRVLCLRLIDGLSFSEVAEQTGQSTTAARMAFRSGQRKLGRLLEESDFPCGEACEYLTDLF